jgi:hypothetical protein
VSRSVQQGGRTPYPSAPVLLADSFVAEQLNFLVQSTELSGTDWIRPTSEVSSAIPERGDIVRSARQHERSDRGTRVQISLAKSRPVVIIAPHFIKSERRLSGGGEAKHVQTEGAGIYCFILFSDIMWLWNNRKYRGPATPSA